MGDATIIDSILIAAMPGSADDDSGRVLSLNYTSTKYHMTMSLFNRPVLMTNWVTSSTPNWFQPARPWPSQHKRSQPLQFTHTF